MNAGSAKKPWPSWLFTCRVTSRYMRLKHASPSAAGSAAAIASIRAIAPATETAGASGTGSASDMAVTIRSPSPLRTKTLPSRPRPSTSEHRAERGMSAHLRARSGCINMQAERRAPLQSGSAATPIAEAKGRAILKLPVGQREQRFRPSWQVQVKACLPEIHGSTVNASCSMTRPPPDGRRGDRLRVGFVRWPQADRSGLGGHVRAWPPVPGRGERMRPR